MSASLRTQIHAAGLDGRFDEPLARHLFWRIGGPADVLLLVETADQLRVALSLGRPVTILGNGSNLLVSDDGVRGVSLKLQGQFLQSRIDASAPEPVVEVGAGVRNTALIARMKKAGLGGLGCLVGIPGTLGGAIRMNAGWRLGEISERVVEIEAILPSGRETVRLSAAELAMTYRRTPGLPLGAIVTRVWLRLSDDPDFIAAEQAEAREYLGRRKRTQPLDKPSCGSVFKNPEGDYAGRLIEVVGLKGEIVGGAQISEKHANFIVNLGGATASDVTTLIRRAQRRVFEAHGIRLHPEVCTAGAWPAPLSAF